MTDRFRHVLVGITALCGVVGLAALLMLFGYVPGWLEGGYEIRIHMAEASGLNAGSRAKLHGIDVGGVKRIDLQQPVGKGVLVTVNIKDKYSIPADVRTTVSQSLLGGSPALELDATHLAGKDDLVMLPRDGSAVIEAKLASLTNQVTEQIKNALDGPTKDLNRLVNAFELLATEWASVGKNINDLTSPRSPADVDGSNGAKLANMTTVLARADQRLADMKQVLDGINSVVNDPKMRDDLKLTLTNLKDASANIKDVSTDAKTLVAKTGENVDEFVESARGNLDQLTKRYVAVADDLSGAILSMRKTIDTAREGDGTMAKLLNDPSLYNNLNDSVKKLDSALVDMKLLIQKWEKEGILKF